MPKRLRFTQRMQAMVDAIELHRGNVAEACRATGTSREQHQSWLMDIPRYARAVEDLKEAELDRAEAILVKKMEQDPELLMFFLSNKGKRRGYAGN